MTNNLEILIMFGADFDQSQLSSLKKMAPQVAITNLQADEVTTEMIKKADIIFGWPKKEDLKKAENLKWLHLPSAGASKYIDQSLYHNQDIILTNSSGVYGLPIAEHILGMILAFNNNLSQYFEQQQQKEWQSVRARRDIYGSTCGIIGFGNIGREVAKRAQALGSRVLALKRTVDQVPDYVDKLYTQDEINQVLKESDYIILSLPITEETKGIISAQELQLMKKDAFLVNVGRGELVVQNDLIKALTEGWIAGAGLDVTTPEPLPEDSPLWELSNVIITPHCSGYSPTNSKRLYDIFSKNLESYMKGQPLKNRVNFRVGY
ncbi:D-2-hydroxyacid dehydrogenase [Halanaerocella petrolearia]